MLSPDELRRQYDRRFHEIVRVAHGRWTEILLHFGVEERLLRKKNQQCPMPSCDGSVDRFSYTDKFGDGNYFCRHCGAGGGFELLRAWRGWRFTETLRALEHYLAIDPSKLRADDESRRRDERVAFVAGLVRRLACESLRVCADDEAGRYLASRGLAAEHYPPSLRFHPAVELYESGPQDGKPVLKDVLPALLAFMQDDHDRTVAVQRTYLKGGRKLAGNDCRKMLGNGNTGAAVRLGMPTDTLSTCEGLENGLAVYLRFNTPVWPAMNAGNLERLWIPEHVRNLKIYGDNDTDGCYDGQASAFALARRVLKSRSRDRCKVDVFIPRRSGSDWGDVYQLSQTKRSAA